MTERVSLDYSDRTKLELYASLKSKLYKARHALREDFEFIDNFALNPLAQKAEAMLSYFAMRSDQLTPEEKATLSYLYKYNLYECLVRAEEPI